MEHEVNEGELMVEYAIGLGHGGGEGVVRGEGFHSESGLRAGVGAFSVVFAVVSVEVKLRLCRSSTKSSRWQQNMYT